DGVLYSALSYAWGSNEKTNKIEVDNSVMHVTKNLFEASQHLRFGTEDRILWIDAISIDQSNELEKGHQVRQMGNIYKEAEQVVVWLGTGSNLSGSFMEIMKQFERDSLVVHGDWRTALQSELFELLSQPWFQRIWVLQEIANARVATFLCGTTYVSSRIFSQSSSLLGLDIPLRCQAVFDIMPGFSRKESWWGQKRSLHTLLFKFRESLATDERDRIFALLGMSSDAFNSNIVTPDYTKSLEEVVKDTVRIESRSHIFQPTLDISARNLSRIFKKPGHNEPASSCYCSRERS
ncbi:HET-domain-containing protein, partial [Cadophora sp. DSE1049]